MGEITSASQEQSSGIEQVNQAVAQMDETTQQNAALVEQAAAAAENMQLQAAKLAQLITAFKLGAGVQASAGNAAGAARRTARPETVRTPQYSFVPASVFMSLPVGRGMGAPTANSSSATASAPIAAFFSSSFLVQGAARRLAACYRGRLPRNSKNAIDAK